MPDEELRVAITVATRGRPAGCRRLVEALLDQDIPEAWRLRIIVVDNNATPYDLAVRDDARVSVVHEPQPGIPYARNRGVKEGLDWAQVIVFIDDDELPATATWLRRLVLTLEDERADLATGPVIPVLPSTTPSWIRAHPLFLPPRRRAGSQLTEAYTGNLAMKANVLADASKWFDEALGHRGGSDTELTRRLAARGHRIVWAEASVEEFVPPERATLRWIVRRSFRIGANRVDRLRLTGGRSQHLFLLAGALAELAFGVALATTIVVGRRDWSALGLGRSARAIGTLFTSAGFRFDEYA